MSGPPRPPLGSVALGDLDRVEPISRAFGADRGTPIDRYYIEGFLARHAGDIRGRVLEIGDATYTRRFGGGRVAHSDVLNVVAGLPETTIVGDLTHGEGIADDVYDCLVLTQTLNLIFDMRAAVATLRRILKPGGVALVTVPGITPSDLGMWRDIWNWSLTPHAARRLFAERFPEDAFAVEAHGNVLAAITFLHGLALEEVRRQDLDVQDPAYPVIVTVRAVKPEAGRV